MHVPAHENPTIRPQSHFHDILHFVPNFTFPLLITLTPLFTLAFSSSAWLPLLFSPVIKDTVVCCVVCMLFSFSAHIMKEKKNS